MTFQNQSWINTRLVLIVTLAIFKSVGAQNDQNSAIISRLERIEDKMDEMDTKLDVLTDRQEAQSVLGSLDRKLDLLLQEEQHNGDQDQADPGQTVTGPPVQAATEYPEQHEADMLLHMVSTIEIVSVERIPTSQGNQFTINFTKSGNCSYQVYELDNPMSEPEHSVSGEGSGVWSVTFTAESSQDELWFLMTCRSHNDGTVSLALNNSASDQPFEENLYTPIILSSKSGIVTYQPGENLNFTTFAAPHPTNGEHFSHFEPTFSGIDLDTGRFQIFMKTEGLIEERDEIKIPEGEGLKFTVLTSEKAISGRLALRGTKHFDKDAVVRHLEVATEIQIRPANQTGEMPPNYLAVVEIPFKQKSKNGNELDVCSVGHQCPIYCYSAGERITGMNVFKVLQDDTMEPIDSAQEAPTMLPNTRGIYWMFTAEEDSGDMDGITTFTCRVYGTDNFQYKDKLLDVQAAIAPSMDHENSSILVERVSYASRRITMKCAVRGRPLPEVTFDWDVQSPLRLEGVPPDYVILSSEYEALATKTLVVDADDLVSWRQQQEGAPYCSLFSSRRGDYLVHRFEIPDAPHVFF